MSYLSCRCSMDLIDLTGVRFGMLLVTGRAPDSTNSQHSRMWHCICDCGNEKIKAATDLKNKRRPDTHIHSCGCHASEVWAKTMSKTKTIHGKCYTQEYRLFHNAKIRAKRKVLPFNIVVEDIYIPEFCPIFPWILLQQVNLLRYHPTACSLDRLIPDLGYVKGNINVISMRANRLKNNATPEELEHIANWVNSKLVK